MRTPGRAQQRASYHQCSSS
uniref:Uncharacterized protein n=1 Tax=Arundo donax TaxID=35708 RepID=A0A0A9GXW8_ARUDO